MLCLHSNSHLNLIISPTYNHDVHLIKQNTHKNLNKNKKSAIFFYQKINMLELSVLK